MKVVHIHRPARSGGYSIETVFKTIAVELRTQGISVLDYELGNRWQFLTDVIRLWRLNADVYHVTGDVNYWILLLPTGKTVLTVHDIGHYLFGLAGWRKSLYKCFWLILPVRKASQITIVSDATRRDLSTYLHISSEAMSLIDNCFCTDFPIVSSHFKMKCPRILQIGTGRNKNIVRLIQALAGISCTLVLIGKINSDIATALQVARISHENFVDISRTELLDQYVLADLVSFVSTSEGFGMPIIEAQAMGKPLITANLPPMSIVAGPEACLVDPHNIALIRAGIEQIIHDDAFRERIVQAGLINVMRYSARVVAAKYLQVYQRLYLPSW